MKNDTSDPDYVAYLIAKWEPVLTSPLSGNAKAMLIESQETWAIPKDE